MPDPISSAGKREPDLFDFAPPPKPTTMTIADGVSLRVAPKRTEQIKQLIRQHGPLALWEMADHLGISDNRISGRVTDLKKSGELEPTGERRARPGSSAPGEVYRLTGAPIT